MQSLEERHRELLDGTKALHSSIKQALSDDAPTVKATLKEWKSSMAQMHKEVSSIRRQAAMQKEMHESTIALMREEMRDELVEREAVAARTAERFRSFCSRGSPNMQSAFDRAARTASSIDACVNALSSESLNCSQGTVLLHQQAMDDAGA